MFKEIFFIGLSILAKRGENTYRVIPKNLNIQEVALEEGLYSKDSHTSTHENLLHLANNNMDVDKIENKERNIEEEMNDNDFSPEFSMDILPLSAYREKKIQDLLMRDTLEEKSFLFNQKLNKNNIYYNSIIKNNDIIYFDKPNIKLIEIIEYIFEKFEKTDLFFNARTLETPSLHRSNAVRDGERMERIIQFHINEEKKRFLDNKEDIKKQWWIDNFSKIVEDNEKILNLLSLLDEGLNFSLCNPYFAQYEFIGLPNYCAVERIDILEKWKKALKEHKAALKSALSRINKENPINNSLEEEEILKKSEEIRKKIQLLNIKLYLNSEYIYLIENKETVKENMFQDIFKNLERDIAYKIFEGFTRGTISFEDYADNQDIMSPTAEELDFYNNRNSNMFMRVNRRLDME